MICERCDWCLYAGPADNPTAFICARVESRWRCGESGWLHKIRTDDAWQPSRRTIRIATKQVGTPGIDFGRLAAQCAAMIGDSRLFMLATDLGVSALSLRRLAIGWSHDHGAWTLPMADAAGTVVGIRLRLPSGRKLSVRGGHEGLFLPAALPRGEQLLVTEGPTDCAALIDLRFAAVGRPSCTGGVALLCDLVRELAPPEVAIFADGDEPGQRGAANLASSLLAYCPVRVITPPSGAKDARAWVRAGASTADVQAAIDAAPVRRLTISTRCGSAVQRG